MTEDAARERMVQEQLVARNVSDPRVLKAMLSVPRHLFVPERLREQAYEDRPHAIGAEQTISQPLMVAIMSALLNLQGDETVLEIGTGSGYQAAILAELAARVISIERHAPLADRARCLLDHLGYGNVEIHVADGTLGYPQLAPFDRILVTAAAPSVPSPLLDQLAPGGKLVIPVGDAEMQTLTVVHKSSSGDMSEHECGPCVFVPLVGSHGWEGPPPMPPAA